MDKDETFSIKKAFRKTLKIRKDKNNNKTPKKPSPNKNNNNTMIPCEAIWSSCRGTCGAEFKAAECDALSGGNVFDSVM